MNIRRTIISVLVMFGALQVHAQEQDTTFLLSLKRSCELGIEKNVDVRNTGLDQEKTRFQLKEAESKLLPQLEGFSNFNYYFAIPKMVLPGEIFGQTGLISVEIGTKYDWSTGIKATQIIYNQSYFTSLRLAERMVELGDLTLEQKREEVVYQVSQLYYLCATTKMQIAQMMMTLENNDRLLQISRLQSENGVIRKVDYARVAVNRSNLQTQIDNLEQLYQQQLGLLKYLIGIDLAQKVELADSLTFDSLDISQDIPDFNHRTELQLLQSKEDMTLLQQRVSRQSYLPTLSGFGQYYFQGQRNKFDFFDGGNDKFFKVGFVGLSLSVPIFSGFEKRAKSSQFDIELRQLQNTREDTKAYFSKEYTDAIRQYDNSMKALSRQEENIKVAEEAYDISVQGYKEQVVSLSDLILSESSLAEARLSYYNALMHLKNAELDVKKAKGELLNN